MLGLNNHQYGENIKNIPSDDSYPMISILFSKKDAMGVNALSLTVLDLINKSQIKCDIGLEGSYEVGKKLTPQDMEVMKKITLRIANKGELKTSETRAINLLKNMNKNKKFDLKSMAKQSNNSSIANKFEKDFNEFVESFKNENGYNGKNYKDFLENAKLTSKGKEVKKEWKDFQTYLKSNSWSIFLSSLKSPFILRFPSMKALWKVILPEIIWSSTDVFIEACTSTPEASPTLQSRF